MRFTLKRRSKKRLFIEIGVALVVIISLSLFVYLKLAQGVTRTWDGGCGADTSWSCDANWSNDTRPGSGDIAAFDNTSDNDSTVDASFAGSVAGVDINSGYDGTITMARSLTVGASHFDQASGVWNGADQSLVINNSGNFTVSGGTHNATTGTWTIEDSFNHSGGTLNAAGTTITFGDTLNNDDSTFTCSGTYSGSVAVNKDSGGDFTLASGCTVTSIGTFNVDGGAVVIDGSMSGGTNLTISNNLTIGASGSLSYSGTLTFDDVLNNHDTTFTCTGTHADTIAVVKDSGGDFTLASGCTTTSLGSFDVDGGAVVINGSMSGGTNLTISNNLTIGASGSLSYSGTLTFDDVLSTHDTTFTCTGTHSSTVNIVKDSGGDFTLASGCTASAVSTFDVDDGATIVNGSVSGPTDVTIERSLTIGASGSLSFSGSLNFNGSSTADDGTFTCTGTQAGTVIVTKTSGTANQTISSGCSITLGDATSTAGSIFNSGTIDIPNGITINVEESFGSSDGTLTGTGTVDMSGTSTGDDGTFACNGSFPGTVIITKSASTADIVIDSGCAITLGDATDTAGSITNNGTIAISSSQTVNIEQSFLSASGTVNNQGILTFDGTSSGSDTNLSCNGNIGDVTINKTSASGDTTLLSNCTVEDFTRTDGPIINPASAYILTVQGDLSTSTSDNFGGANMTLNFSGTNAQTITRNTTTISTPLTVNKTSGTVTQLSDITVPSLTVTDGTFLNSTLALTVSGTMSISDTFTQGSGTVTATTYSVGSAGVYQTTSTGDIVVGSGGVANSGHITIGTQSSCPATNNIDITSSTPGTQRSWTGNGSTRLYDANVTDQGGSATVNAFSSTSVSGNGDNWFFINGCTLQTRIGSGLRLGDGARLR